MPSTHSQNPSEPQRIHPRAAFQHPDFRFFQAARFLSIIGSQMLSVTVGWQVYEITRDPLDLGYLGLALFLPAVGFALLTGRGTVTLGGLFGVLGGVA